MNIFQTLLVIYSSMSSISVSASDYYQDDGYNNNYGDSMGEYFDGQQPAAGGNNLLKLSATSAVGWFLGGKIHSKRAAKALKGKHSKERAAFVQLYREQVGALQEFNKESARIIQAMESSIIARQNGVPAEIDTVPFFMADTDGSKKISKAEFDRYVREYLVNYPGLKPEDVPRWESFDHDLSGQITFDEYNQQMAKEIRKAQYRAAKN